MNTTPFTCDDFDASLAALLEDELDSVARVAAEAHAAECVRCAGLLADLNEIRADAAQLPVLKPSRDLWDGIASRIEPPVMELPQPGVLHAWQRPSRLAAAAVLLIAATATVTWTVARQGAESAGDVPTLAADADDATPATRLVAAYDPEIAELRAMLAERGPSLDTATVRVLEENLRIIDDAIARSRAALDVMPANAFLARQLARAYDQKLHTLRRIASMPAE
jgi:hypothetical protein